MTKRPIDETADGLVTPTMDLADPPSNLVPERVSGRPIDDTDQSGAVERTEDLSAPPKRPPKRPIEDTGMATPTIDVVAPQYASNVHAAADLPIVLREHYRVIAEYARGGLGRIVRARDSRTGRVVAIKEMLGKSDDAARRFAREALITANLQHPAIVPVYEVGRWDTGEPFYAMKLVVGKSFHEVITGCKTLDERLARLAIVVSVSEALAYAHGRRVIHRDLKPANVLVGDLGETVVIDWGLAKQLDQPDDHESTDDDEEAILVPDEIGPLRTRAGAVMGTPSYMPPEQTRGEATDERSDVYQIGALLYHLIAGAAPYSERKISARELLKIVAVEPPQALAEREPGTPSDLLTIVAKAMARAPHDRYATAAELSEDLRRFTTGQLVGAHHYDRRTLFVRWLKRNRAPVTVGGVLALALAGVAIWSVHSILAERDKVQTQRDIAVQETARAEDGLAAALYEKGRIAEGQQEWARAAMYYAAARRHHDAPASAWAAGLAEARAVIPSVRHLGHTAWVHAVAISPDGQRVASVDDAGWLRVWSPSDGHLFGTRELTKHALYAVAFSPDGRELAVGGDDGAIERLSIDLGPLATLRGHTGRIWTVTYAPDGATLASGGEDATIRLWPLAGGEPRVLAGHTQRVYSVAYSPDGKQLASGSDDRHVRVWDVATGVGIDRGSHAGGGIRVVTFTPNGESIITTGWDHDIRVWTGTAVEPTEMWSDIDTVHGAAIAPTGGIFITAGEMPAIHAWDISTHKLVTSLDAPGGQISALALSRDGHWLVTAGKAAPIAWDASALRRVSVVGHRGAVTGLAFSADGTRFVSGSGDHTLRMWSVATGTELRRVPVGTLRCSDGVAIVGDDLLASCDDSTLRRWSRGRDVAVLKTNGWLRTIAMSRDDATLAAGYEAGRVMLVDVPSWKIVIEKTLHAHHIYGVQFAGDGRLVTASLDDHIRVWRVPALVQDLDVKVGADDGSLAAALAPDGSLLAIGTQDGSLDIWDTKAASWRKRDVGAKSLGIVWKLIYSPDGKQVYTASDDGIVRIWDTTTWTSPALLDAGESSSLSLALSPDGTKLVAGYKSGAIAIWDVASRRLVERIGGRTRDRGTCADVATQVWSDGAHRAIVDAACTQDARTYFDQLATHSHQKLNNDVDVTWDWQ